MTVTIMNTHQTPSPQYRVHSSRPPKAQASRGRTSEALRPPGGFSPLAPSLRSSVAPAGGNLSERFSVAENRGWPNVGRWGTEGVRGDGWVKGRGHRVPRECAV